MDVCQIRCVSKRLIGVDTPWWAVLPEETFAFKVAASFADAQVIQHQHSNYQPLTQNAKLVVKALDHHDKYAKNSYTPSDQIVLTISFQSNIDCNHLASTLIAGKFRL